MPNWKKVLLIGFWVPGAVLSLALSFFVIFYLFQVTDKKLASESPRFYPGNQTAVYAALPEVLGDATTNVESKDARAEILRQYFSRYKSPLEPYSTYIVEVSDNYGFDFRLLPSIAMQESNLCQKIPENSYNCWGYGIYGDKVLRFRNYEEAIERVAKALREDYVDKGLQTPEQIMSKYTPPSVEKGGPWAVAIRQFFTDLQ